MAAGEIYLHLNFATETLDQLFPFAAAAAATDGAPLIESAAVAVNHDDAAVAVDGVHRDRLPRDDAAAAEHPVDRVPVPIKTQKEESALVLMEEEEEEAEEEEEEKEGDSRSKRRERTQKRPYGKKPAFTREKKTLGQHNDERDQEEGEHRRVRIRRVFPPNSYTT